MAESQFRLLRQRRYAPFFLTQALGALNDNLLKNALIILATYHAAAYSQMNPNVLTQLAAALYIAPFLVFSALAGQLADKYDKTRIMRIVKIAEVGIMGMAGIGFALHSVTLLLAALVGLGLHSTFFGPAKYGYLPQTLRQRELVGGNALLESGTFLAILGGTLLAGILAAHTGAGGVVMAALLVAGLGVAASRAIPGVAPAAPDLNIQWNPVAGTWRILRETARHRTVFLSLLGISWFWALGAVLLSALPGLGRFVIGGDASVVTVLLAVFSVGVGIGSLACEKLSRRSLEIGLVPFGAFGLSAGLLLFYRSLPDAPIGTLTGWGLLESHWPIALALASIGLFGGLFIVPLYALVQARSHPRRVSRVQAANNALNALAMVVATLGSGLALDAGVSLPTLLLAAAVINLVVAVYIFTLVPEFLYRFLAWCLVSLLYRFRVRGAERIPDRGGALLVCNHVSYVDALVISASVHRPVRFVMDHNIYKLPVLNWIFRSNRTIPIASRRDNPELLDAAYAEIAQALKNGELVCIFPEGRLTRDGEIGEFRPGILRILEEVPVPVIPLALSGLWGSLVSRAPMPEKLFRRLRPWRAIGVEIGNSHTAHDLDLEALKATVSGMRECP